MFNKGKKMEHSEFVNPGPCPRCGTRMAVPPQELHGVLVLACCWEPAPASFIADGWRKGAEVRAARLADAELLKSGGRH